MRSAGEFDGRATAPDQAAAGDAALYTWLSVGVRGEEETREG